CRHVYRYCSQSELPAGDFVARILSRGWQSAQPHSCQFKRLAQREDRSASTGPQGRFPTDVIRAATTKIVRCIRCDSFLTARSCGRSLRDDPAIGSDRFAGRESESSSSVRAGDGGEPNFGTGIETVHGTRTGGGDVPQYVKPGAWI